jgi:hypothetical protein
MERWRHDSVNVNASVFLAAQRQVKSLIKQNQTKTAATGNGGTP